jgi:hypothetical protein
MIFFSQRTHRSKARKEILLREIGLDVAVAFTNEACIETNPFPPSALRLPPSHNEVGIETNPFPPSHLVQKTGN